MSVSYDRIGRSYTTTRRADPRIEAQIHGALGDAASVVNVGAGAGSYEPRDRRVVAVEPSATMIAQRAPDASPAMRAVAEALPFPDRSFDTALGVLTMHHWSDVAAGLRELRRVARRQVLMLFEPSFADQAWIVADYFPEMVDMETERNAPSVDDLARVLDVHHVEPVLVPGDCLDGFGGAYWNRPEEYLRPEVQAGMSCFAQMDPDVLARGMDRLRMELETGHWDAKYGALRAMSATDLGYRLVVAGLP
ncbi:MAG TPA: class I SAM-dependent methyltransferase [Acidimicrobiia bacterium]|nr:class I SAM-dependent methyltransferase [Acidimicrobiia bacterium]